MIQIALRAAVLGCVFLLGGCSLFRPQNSVRNVDPGGQQVSGVDQSGAPMVSPDGKKLLWHMAAGDDITTLVRDTESGEMAVFRLGRAFTYWAFDSRHLIVEQDRADGGTQIIVLDTAQPKSRPVNMTPWDGAKSYVLHIGNARTGKITFISNRRDGEWFDVYVADLATGHTAMAMQNSGQIVQWVMDEDGTVGARVRQQDDHYILQVLGKTSRTWKSVYKWRKTDTVLPMRIDRDGGKAVLVTNTGGKKTELIELTLTGPGKQGK